MESARHNRSDDHQLDNPRLRARHRKTQRIRINSATSTPILGGLVAVPMVFDRLETWRIASWIGPWLLAGALAGWAAWRRRGDLHDQHPLDRWYPLPAGLALLALPFLVAHPTTMSRAPEVLMLALVASTAVLTLVGLQYRRHRRRWIGSISAIGLWFSGVFVAAGNLSYGLVSAFWTINLCLAIIYALNSRDDLAEISDDNLRMARLDGMTGALNREGLVARWHATRGTATEHTLLLIDLDRFKNVNDQWGHTVGDGVLIEATRRLFDTVGAIGEVARLGGDEFASLMPGGLDAPAVSLAIDRLADAFEQPFLVEGKVLGITASIGVVAMEQDDEIAVALTNADYAMFDAKRRPHESVSVFDPEMRAALDRRRYLEGALPKAIENDEFEWWGQPILSTHTLQPVGVELLCRWKHDGSYQNPGEFLQVLGDINLLSDLGRKNLEFAAMWLERWRTDKELSDVGVNVNLTPQHLLTTAVGDITRSVPDADRGRLGVELVETEVIPQGAGLRSEAERLRQMGCRLVLDDFGAGYSALSVLSDLRVSTIKIDRSLVAGLDNDDRKTKLVEAASQIGLTLGTSTVCEGVETEAELDAIREIGIPLVQGWLFSKALPMNECDVLLRKLSRIARREFAESFDEIRSSYQALPTLV